MRAAHVHGLPAPVRAILLACSMALLATTAQADASYWRLGTPHITVIADGTARHAAKLATQVLTYERILREQTDLDASFPARTFTLYSLTEIDAQEALISKADKRRQYERSMRIFSKFFPGRDSNMAAVVDIDGQNGPLQAVLLQYGQTLLNTGPTRAFPTWYQVGIAQLANGIVLREDGSALLSRQGDLAPSAAKSASVDYDLPTLLATTAQDVNTGGDLRAYMQHAHDWVLFGLFTTPARRTAFKALANLMRQGVKADEAVPKAFGVPLAELAREFKEGNWHGELLLAVPAPEAPLALPAAGRLEPAAAREQLQRLADRATQPPPGAER